MDIYFQVNMTLEARQIKKIQMLRWLIRLTIVTNTGFVKLFSVLQVSVAMGCATRNRTVAFASTFAAFLSRAYDHIRMGAISQSNVNLCGSHCGVSIGEF